MELAFPWPYSGGEWLAWISAVVTILFGLFLLFAPETGLKVLRLQTLPDHPEAVATARGNLAGFYLGLGIACVLLSQPLLYLALGLCWALTGFGRLVSMLSDNGSTLYNWAALAIEIVLAVLALLFAFGFVEFTFSWPPSGGEWLAWTSAVVTILFGLFLLFAPETGLKVLRLQTLPDHPEAVATARANLVGFYLGLGIACVLYSPQPLLYLALGLCWALTGFGRLVSMLSDNGSTLYNWIALAIEIVLSVLALLFAFGFVA